jgi:hypothetical protein
MYDGCVDVVLPPQLTAEVTALKEPVDCSYCEHEATGECGGGLSRPRARIMVNKGSALIVACFLAFPAMIWRRILA